MAKHVEDIIKQDHLPFPIFHKKQGKIEGDLKPLNLEIAWKHFEPSILRKPRMVEESGGKI